LQILRMDLRNDKIKLRIDNLDDLWTIHKTVRPGDLVLARTFRREKIDTEDARPERGEKKPVFLGIRVEKVELHKYVNMVRLLGRIERGVDVGSYHSLNIEPRTQFSIVREWNSSEIRNLRSAVKDSKRPSVLVVALEEGEASFGIVRQRGVDFLNTLSYNIPGKREKGSRETAERRFHSQVMKTISDISESKELKYVLVAGPELTRTGFKKFVDEEGGFEGIELSYETCFSPGTPGIYEAIRRGAVERLVQSSRVTMELTQVERLLEEIGKEGKATYGPDHVENAVRSGAVETLLVTDEFLRENRERADELINLTEQYSGEHFMISTDHEAGHKLQSLGGLGAILRYMISG